MTSTRPSPRAASLAAALLVLAAGAAPAQQRPAARPLGPALATSEPLAALSAVRALPGGRVLVNDPRSRRVLLMDSALKVIAVVADSTPSTANAYGPRPGGLLAYRGDSTLFVDPSSLSMLVIDPEGKIARVMAAPRPDDVGFLVGGPLGNPGFDARGRLIYRTLNRNFMGMRMGPGGPAAAATPAAQPDTEPLIRYDLATRTLDTAAFIKVPVMRMVTTETERGRMQVSARNPLPVIDDWAVLPDGNLAIVRGRDYRVEYVGPTGARTVGEKLAFDWQRLTDDDKTRIIDSVKKASEAAIASGQGGLQLGGAPAGVVGAGGAEPVRLTITTTVGAGGAPGAGGPPANFTMPKPVFVDPSELPDYRPAFAGGATRADTEGRLWVRTNPTKPLAGGPEYDVIDRSGKLAERVAIPKGTTIVGFGADGIVYLGVRDAAGTHVVRARIR